MLPNLEARFAELERQKEMLLAELEGLGLLYLEVGVRLGDLGLREVLALDRLGVRIGDADAHLALLVADAGLLLEVRRLLADDPLLLELGDAHGALAVGVARANVPRLVLLGDLDHPLALSVGDIRYEQVA